MKTVLVAAAIGAVGIATSMADPVYSANVVGFVNITVPTGYVLICNPLQGTNNTLGVALPTVPDGSSVFRWDPSLQSFGSQIIYDSGIFGGWEVPDTTINPGEGFFLNSAAPATITFVGEVRQGNLASSLVPGYNFVGSQVPQAGGVTSALGFTPADGDSAFQWNVGAQAFGNQVIFDSGIFGGWESEPTLGMAEALVVVRSDVGSWTRTFNVQ